MFGLQQQHQRPARPPDWSAFWSLQQLKWSALDLVSATSGCLINTASSWRCVTTSYSTAFHKRLVRWVAVLHGTHEPLGPDLLC